MNSSNDYPYLLAKDIASLLKNIRERYDRHPHLLTEHNSADKIIAFSPKESGSHYYFSVEKARIDDLKRTFFEVTFLPATDISLQEAHFELSEMELLGKFDLWASLLEKHINISFDRDPTLIDISHHGADTPFNKEDQTYIIQLLMDIEAAIQKNKAKYDPATVDSIVKETAEFKTEVAASPKNKFIAKLFKLFAYLKKQAFDIFKDLLKDKAKELIKLAIKAGWEYLDNRFNLLK